MKMKFRKHRARVARLAATLAATIGLVLAVGLAPASAHPLDNTDPAATGCSSGSSAIYGKTIYSGGTAIGLMEVRYSPSCGTNWVRVNNYGYYPRAGKLIYVAPSGAYTYTGDSYVGWSYGLQVYAPGSTCIHVEGTIRNSSDAVVGTTGVIQLC